MSEIEDSRDDGRSALPEFTKKLLSLGLGAYFLTEEKLMSYVREAKLPKEIGSSISQNASKAKDEVLSFVTREISKAFQRFDVHEELERLLATHKIKITAEIQFEALDKPAEPGSGIQVETTIAAREDEAPVQEPEPGPTAPELLEPEPIEPEPIEPERLPQE